MSKTFYVSAARTEAYEKAQAVERNTLEYGYWIGVAHALGTQEEFGTRVPIEFFVSAPPYITGSGS